jgi:hypothetical protein
MSKPIRFTDYQLVIGIDPGTHTGFAVWDRGMQAFQAIITTELHLALVRVMALRSQPILLVIEDARRRGGSKETMLGAGSVRRDCTIWQEFCDYHNIPVIWKSTPRRGAGTTKLSAEVFGNLTGYKLRTSNHARDAAMLVWKT